MRTRDHVASLLIVATLGIAMSYAAAEFYAGEEATGLESTVMGILDAVGGPLFAALILLLLVAVVASAAAIAASVLRPTSRGGGGYR